ncbi:Fis family transcriptional regulator [Mycolicibacterium fortuitum]|uniref:Fis family transcriptional regulator n=1 Tax=Mycolicibacterium fortuitum TaxID=1766 RepID=A0A378UAE7_MYCFO|nr:Fis family transcriptional regulator [Mycolicibacterium fortuitum]
MLGDTATRLLTNPDTGVIAPQLQVIVDALTAMPRANSGLTWIRQKHVDQALRELARHATVTHEIMDQFPLGKTTNYIRSLLVEHKALPARDERLATFQSWAAAAQQRITTDEHQKVMARFIRWGLEKRLRSMATVTDSAFQRAKQTVTVTIEFCNWLTAEHAISIELLTQSHIDLWQASGPTTREHIVRFIRWAIATKLVASDLEVTPHRRGTAPRLPIGEQNAVIEKVVHQQTMHPRDRFAAILIIVFAQRAENIAALTWDRITIAAESVSVDLAGIPIEMPTPLDEPIRILAAANYNGQTAAHPNSPWVFRGHRPGTHLTPTHLRTRLRPVLAALEARLGTLNELTQTTPIAILAETLGYNPQTLEAHARASATTYARYMATRLDLLS